MSKIFVDAARIRSESHETDAVERARLSLDCGTELSKAQGKQRRNTAARSGPTEAHQIRIRRTQTIVRATSKQIHARLEPSEHRPIDCRSSKCVIVTNISISRCFRTGNFCQPSLSHSFKPFLCTPTPLLRCSIILLCLFLLDCLAKTVHPRKRSPSDSFSGFVFVFFFSSSKNKISLCICERTIDSNARSHPACP